jgi:predicted MFS family arabinose efflux permease
MSGPGMYTYLMGNMPAGDRSAASALNFLVTFSAQAIAAAAAGAFVTRFGYPAVLLSAALICAAAAILFRLLADDPKPDPAAER